MSDNESNEFIQGLRSMIIEGADLQYAEALSKNKAGGIYLEGGDKGYLIGNSFTVISRAAEEIIIERWFDVAVHDRGYNEALVGLDHVIDSRIKSEQERMEWLLATKKKVDDLKGARRCQS